MRSDGLHRHRCGVSQCCTPKGMQGRSPCLRDGTGRVGSGRVTCGWRDSSSPAVHTTHVVGITHTHISYKARIEADEKIRGRDARAWRPGGNVTYDG